MSSIYDLLKQKSLEELVAENTAIFDKQNPGLRDSESDYFTPAIRSFSEKEARIRAEFVHAIAQMFWMDAEGEALDYCASEFEVYRLEGTKPTANISFSIPQIYDIDITIPAGTNLLSTDQDRASTINDIVIPAGSLSAIGICELEQFVVSSDAKTETIISPLAVAVVAKQETQYISGKEEESDDNLKERIKLSLATKSAAGPINAYKKLTLDADSRIIDVYVYETNARIQLIVDTLELDAVMTQRISDSVNDLDNRPISDKIDIHKAEVVDVQIQATLTLADSTNTAVLLAAKQNCESRFAKLKIGENVSLAKIIDSLFVDGVVDVNITSPELNIITSPTQVCRISSVVVSQ